MSVERQILESTGWAVWYDAFSIVGVIAGIITVLATALNTWWIPRQAENAVAAKEIALKQQPVFMWPSRLLLEDEWKKVEDAGELEFYVKQPQPKVGEIQTADLIIKDGDVTVSWIKIITLAQNHVWPIGSDKELEDGKNTVSISDAIAGSGIADFIRGTPDVPIDIIGVGLESSFGGDPLDTHRRLSIRRGTQLIRASHNALTIVDPDRTVNYRTLGLGRALDVAVKDTDSERRQRSALIVAVANLQTTPALLSVEKTIASLVLRVELTGVDLSRYEYSTLAEDRLSPSLKLDGDGSNPWKVPDISAEQARER